MLKYDFRFVLDLIPCFICCGFGFFGEPTMIIQIIFSYPTIRLDVVKNLKLNFLLIKFFLAFIEVNWRAFLSFYIS